MAFGNYAGMWDAEGRKSADVAGRAQMATNAAAYDQQQWDRGRQTFQEGVIAQEQQRKNRESQAAIEGAKRDQAERYKKDRLAHWRQTSLMGLANQPAMAAAQAMTQIGDVPGHSVNMYGSNGQRIGGSWLLNGLIS